MMRPHRHAVLDVNGTRVAAQWPFIGEKIVLDVVISPRSGAAAVLAFESPASVEAMADFLRSAAAWMRADGVV